MNETLLTTYLCKRPDPRFGTQYSDADDSLVTGWASSIARLALRGVILHDGLDLQFIERWTSEAIGFQQRAHRADFIFLDRFLLEREWLRENACECAFLTDMTDVEFFANPFAVVTDDRLYVGSEFNWTIQRNGYMRAVMEANYGEIRHGDRIILNPGIIGGRRATLLRFLDDFIDEMQRHASDRDCDLAAFNEVLYRDQWDVVTGSPLHTRFKVYDGNTFGCAIRHK